MKIFTHILSFILSMSVVVSSTGFTLVKHYCHNTVKEVSLYGFQSGCGEMTKADDCHQTNLSSSCCKDQTIHIASTQDFASTPSVLLVDFHLDNPVQLFEKVEFTDFSSNLKYTLIADPPSQTERLARIQRYLI